MTGDQIRGSPLLHFLPLETCIAPPSPINGTLSHPTGALAGQTSRLVCIAGFQPSINSSQNMTCTANGTWDLPSETFYCEKECKYTVEHLRTLFWTPFLLIPRWSFIQRFYCTSNLAYTIYIVLLCADITVGFDQDSYTVYEQAGYVTLRVKVFASNVRTRPVKVTFFTTDGSARASASEPDFINPGETILQFQPGVTYQWIKISIVDDQRADDRESFFAHLKSLDVTLNISLNRTEVIINDLDSKLNSVA